MRRAVIVVLDGLRRDFVTEAYTPNLCAFAERAERFGNHRSVFVSTTRVVSASLATGCHPARHELQGNAMALVEAGRLVAHDAGRPDFLDHKRRVTGRSLGVPTVAERVAELGGSIVFANASPGAAYAQDPDGHGVVHHRAGSFGPGRVPLPEAGRLAITPDVEGDRAMTLRFVREALGESRPAVAVLWLGDPDRTQHASPLGSPRHLEALREADRNAGLVVEAVDRLRDAGDDVLVVLCSDHGHQTAVGVVDIEAELVEAGLKDRPGSGDVLAVANGTSALIYVHPDRRERIADIHDFLASRDWADRVIAEDELAAVGQAPLHGLAFAVSMRSSEAPNDYGVPGVSLVARSQAGKPDRLG
ncbi:MAG TPA: alkaline phosphatase family protein, partial [Thermodesulfobacteriota bacterium]